MATREARRRARGSRAPPLADQARSCSGPPAAGELRTYVASSDREQHMVATGGVDRAWVRALDGLDRLFCEFSSPFVVDSVQARRAAPPAREHGNQLLRGFPPHVLLDHLDLGGGKPRVERRLAESLPVGDRGSGARLVDGLHGGWEPAVDDLFEQRPT